MSTTVQTFKAAFGPVPPPLKVTPAPFEFERKGVFALLVLSVAKVELEKLIKEGAYHDGNAIDERELLASLGALQDIGDNISAAFHRAAERLVEDSR